MEPGSPVLQVDSLSAELPGKPRFVLCLLFISLTASFNKVSFTKIFFYGWCFLHLKKSLPVSKSWIYYPVFVYKLHSFRTSLVVQWPMQGSWVQSLVWEDSMCRGITKPVCHNYWSPCSLEPTLHNKRRLQTATGEEPLLSKTRKRPHAATKTWCSQKLIDF